MTDIHKAKLNIRLALTLHDYHASKLFLTTNGTKSLCRNSHLRRGTMF